MAIVRALAEEYRPDNTLNIDETGLFWKMTPDQTLAIKAKSGGKKAKDRITLALTCSASGKKEMIFKKPVMADDAPDISVQQRIDLQAQIMLLPDIQDPLDIDEYINISDEVIEDKDNDIFEAIIERYQTSEDTKTDEEDEGNIELLRVIDSEALKALEVLKSYEIQQENGSKVVLRALDSVEKRVYASRIQTKKQQLIERYFR
jgi:hypothetical protein